MTNCLLHGKQFDMGFGLTRGFRQLVCQIPYQTVYHVITYTYCISGWRDLTTGDFNIHMFKGGHFYLQNADNAPVLRNMIVKYIKQSL